MVTSAAIAEAFTMGVKAGVAPEALFKVVSGGAFGRGMLLQGLPAVVFKGNFDRPATFALKLARKDLTVATELGREFQVPMPLAAVVEQELDQSGSAGARRQGRHRRVLDAGRTRRRQSPQQVRAVRGAGRGTSALGAVLGARH